MLENLIYKIENKVNGKVYIGQTTQGFNKRISGHKKALKGKYHYNEYLQRAWNKYGEENFSFEVVEYTVKDLLDEKEIYWIEYYNAMNKEYGYNNESGGNFNKIVSEETKKKQRESHLGKVLPEEQKKKISESHKGRPMKEETKVKMKALNLGENNPMYGKHHSEESKSKISNGNKGKIRSEETKKKMSKANKGERNHNYGKHLSEELKQKLSKAHINNVKVSNKVYQYTKDLKLIKIWNSVNEAGRNGFAISAICKCCNGIKGHKSHKGYIWSYEPLN